MLLVVDANILFSALIKARNTRNILLFSGKKFLIPEYAIQEFKKHLPPLMKKTGLSEDEIIKLLETLLEASETIIVPFEEFKYQRNPAKQMSPDPDDIAYIALALHTECAIWSNDKELKKQSKVRIITTKELLEQIQKEK